MKIFISWSGERSRCLANILHGWLGNVIQASRPYVSSRDIGAGARWSESLNEELERADFGIVCVTKNSLSSPWVHFEAGALSKNIEKSRVVPFLFDCSPSDLSEPLGQFQAVHGTRDDMRRLLDDLNNIAPKKTRLRPSQLDASFERFWPDFEADLDNLRAGTVDDAVSAPIEKRVPTTLAEPIKFVGRKEFSLMLLEHLANSSVRTVRLMTYTAEVDARNLERYHIEGQKEIEVFKRSILVDLAAQQECNLKRIAQGVSVEFWQKRNPSIGASQRLNRKPPHGCSVRQFFYVSPPTKRVYLFDDTQAITAYYEVVEDAFLRRGSVYKGVTAPRFQDAMVIERGTRTGDFLIDEIENLFRALRRSCRTWADEESILLRRGRWRGPGPRPCVEPRVVFLDLDGTLYNSMPHYVSAWEYAFAELDVEISEKMVYSEEGRESTETIRSVLLASGIKTSEKLVDRILERKRQRLEELGKPPLQDKAVEMVETIRQSGIPCSVVTGSSREDIAAMLERDFPGLLSHKCLVTGRDVRQGKPNPDPYLLACHLSNVQPHEAVAVENAPLGIASASEAGVFCIGINTGVLPDDDLLAAGTRGLFRSCDHLAECWELVVRMLRS